MFHITMSFSVCFFFSSRRRHTRCLSDWSSDVCSSDLTLEQAIDLRLSIRNALIALGELGAIFDHLRVAETLATALDDQRRRSEERRVGKECRSRWSPDQYKKKKRTRKNDGELT